MISRRSLLGAATGIAGFALSACGGDKSKPAISELSSNGGTPVVPVVGYDDPKRWDGRVLSVAAWGGEVQSALRDVIWQSFANATGCVVREQTTDYAELAKSVHGGKPYADVLLVDEVWAETTFATDLKEVIDATELDRSRFGPVEATDSAIPAYCYAVVNAYRTEESVRIGEPENWAAWWDLERFSSRRTLQRGAFGTFEFALLADGVDPAALYPLDGIRAVESLKRISGKIVDLWWDSALEPVDWLNSNRADLAAAWHFRIVDAQRNGHPLLFQWNQGLLTADSWIVAKGTATRDVAVDLINYATSPEIQAALASVIPLGPVTPASFNLIDSSIAAALPTTPGTVEKLIRVDRTWWAAHKTEAFEQFNCWLLGGPCFGPTPTPAATP